MREYEIVYIFRSTLTPEEVDQKLARYHEAVSEAGGGEVTAVVHWGRRKLAYPVSKQKNGYYLVARFTSGPDGLSALERLLRLEGDVLRFLIVLAEGELSVASPPMDGEGDAEGEAADGQDAEGEGGEDESDDDESADEDESGDDESADEDAGEDESGDDDSGNDDAGADGGSEDDGGEDDTEDEADSRVEEAE